MKLYIVKMERYGDYGGHSYIIGIFTNPFLASLMGKSHKSYRGNKYYPNIIEIDYLGNLDDNNPKVSLIKTWRETENLSIRNLEFKIIDGGHSPEYRDSLLETQKFTIELESITQKIEITSYEEIEDLHQTMCEYSNEELEILRDIYEKYIRNKN